MNWTDDAYPELDGDWTDEELIIAAGNAAFARNQRKHTETEEGGEMCIRDSRNVLCQADLWNL